MHVNSLEIGSLQPAPLQAAPKDPNSRVVLKPATSMRWLRMSFGWSLRAVIHLWQFVCLITLLSAAASLPILQFASLGYLLESAGRWARGDRFQNCLPGLKTAGYIGTAVFWIGITSIPVAIIRDLSAAAALINPDSTVARNWQFASVIVWCVWITYVWWAILRGGRIYHFLWPAPIRFVREFFRPRTWQNAIDHLADGISKFRIVYLLKLGFFGSIGCLMYLILPGSIMIAGLRAEDDGAKALLSLIGIVMMAVLLQYLPFLQIHYAKTKRFRSFFNFTAVRGCFKKAPWLHAISVTLLIVFTIPLYLLRIEMPPTQLVWLLCIFFVALNFPTKFMIAWAIRYGDSRPRQRAWYSRWPAWILLIAGLPAYIFFLYIAALASWDGSAVMILQHAFLTPVPFAINR